MPDLSAAVLAAVAAGYRVTIEPPPTPQDGRAACVVQVETIPVGLHARRRVCRQLVPAGDPAFPGLVELLAFTIDRAAREVGRG